MRYPAIPAVVAFSILSVIAACAPRSLVAQVSAGNQGWSVVAYPQGDEVCLTDAAGTTCTSIRADRRFDANGTSVDGTGIWTVTGITRPEIATVRIASAGQVQEVATVALSFRSDIRAFGMAFEADAMPVVVAIVDAQGNELSDPLLP